MIQKVVLFAWILLLAQVCQAQKEGNIWYFGEHAGLDFNTSPPAPLTGMLVTQEGCSSIADPVTGALLLYTDGVSVWDRNHNQMPASIANPLKGHVSSTQSALIVPQPGSTTRYYIFTAAAMQSGPLCYSVVDLSLNGGNGDLVSWNNVLLDTTTEKLAAVGNCDHSLFWIMGHKVQCDSFYAFRLTSSGISGPVKSRAGLISRNYAGYMKFSADGRRLGLVGGDFQPQMGNVELFDFDFSNGKVLHPIADSIILPPPSHPGNALYGCSFSPDGSKFYVSACYVLTGINPRKIVQYDLSSGNITDILASKTDIASQCDTPRALGALQNGPDGRMYVVTLQGNSIDVIQNPNAAGIACNFQPKAIYYNAGDKGRLGLPNLPENLLAPLPAPEFNPPRLKAICKGDTAWAPQQPAHTFTISPVTGVWISADGTLAGFGPDATTTYTVISGSPCTFSDTIVFTIYVSPRPVAAFVFTPENLRPSDVSLTLTNQSLRAQHYQWYKGNGVFLSSNESPVLPHPGLGNFCYTLVASDSIGCTDTTQHCIEIKDHGPLFIPNTFSPNGDGLNDIFRIYGLYEELLEFSVFNRYGERVFFSANKAKGWDGGYKNRLCDAGIYHYLVKLIDGDGKSVVKKGDITLLR